MARGSTGNVIAAVVSLIVPGAGQLVQGRLVAALFFFVLSGVIWIVSLGFLGWIGHIAAALEAAVWQDRSGRSLP